MEKYIKKDLLEEWRKGKVWRRKGMEDREDEGIWEGREDMKKGGKEEGRKEEGERKG